LVPNGDLLLSVVYVDQETSLEMVPNGSIEVPIYQLETQYWGTVVILDFSKKMPRSTVNVDEYVSFDNANTADARNEHEAKVDHKNFTIGSARAESSNDVREISVPLNSRIGMDSVKTVYLSEIAGNLPAARILTGGSILEEMDITQLPALKISNKFRDPKKCGSMEKPIIKMKTDGSASMVILPEWLDQFDLDGNDASSASGSSSTPIIPRPKKFPKPRDANIPVNGVVPGDWLVSAKADI